jgi:serine protease Do
MNRSLTFLIFLAQAFSAEAKTDDSLLDPRLRLNGIQVQQAFGKTQGIAQESTVKLLRNERVIAHGTVIDSRGFVLSKASACIGARYLLTNSGICLPVKARKRDEACDLVLLEVIGDGYEWPTLHWSDNNNSTDARWAISASPELDEIRLGLFGGKTRPIGREGGVMGVVLSDDNQSERGIRVLEVIPQSAADRAGLKINDRILKIDHRSVRSKQQVNHAMQKKDPGDLVLLHINRVDEAIELRVTLGHRSVTFDLFNRNLLMSGPTSKRKDNFPLVLQHDIPLYRNNMGGPVFNLEGQCVGINIARVDRVTNFALPHAVLYPILRDWLKP